MTDWTGIKHNLRITAEEAHRLLGLIEHHGLKSIRAQDALHYIDRPDGKGLLLIGEVGARSILRAAEIAIEGDQEAKGHLSATTLQTILKKAFVKCLVEGKKLNNQCVKSLVRSSLARAKSKHIKTYTYFIPCILSYESTQESLTLGPVEFITTDRLLRDLDGDLREHTKKHQDQINAQNPTIDREEIIRRSSFMENETRSYYSSYRWAAKITIKGFDSTLARAIAERTGEAAINFLRLFIGADHADRMRLAIRMKPIEKSSEVVITDDGFSIRGEWQAGHAILDENWIDLLLEGERGKWLRGSSDLIWNYQRPGKVPLIYTRFLSALWWYGEAVSEPFNHAKIIRYCASLEALLGTPKGEISHKISLRCAYLCSGDVNVEGAFWYEKTKNLYTVRSNLLHGSLPPTEMPLGRISNEAEKICRRALTEGLAWTMWLARTDRMMGRSDIEQHMINSLPFFSLYRPLD